MGREKADTRIHLPPPKRGGTRSVEEALQQRRSIREYTTEQVTLVEAAQLLWAALGVTHPEGHRTVPSAGALNPLAAYVVTGGVVGLEAGVYRYLPESHELVETESGDQRRRLAAVIGQDWVAEAPAALVLAGIYERTAVKYGARAKRYVHIEIGHAVQNVYLQAVALDLGTVVVGAFQDERVQDVLGLPDDHAPLAIMPVGRPG
jgi:SagB-type dehydrogenase family enzyme